MGDDSTGNRTVRGESESDVRDELRTIGFRLRELQRLGSIRLEQENRRLEADGLEPVTESRFFKRTERPREVSREAIRRLVEELGELTVDEYARVSLIDGTHVEGHAGPIDYAPDESLRVELTPTHSTDVRYELRSTHEDDGWTGIRVRKFEQGDEDWTSLAQVFAVSTDAAP